MIEILRQAMNHGRILDESCRPIHNTTSLRVHPTSKQRYLGATVHFSCASGFVLQGYRSVLCLETGSWSHYPPNCQGMQRLQKNNDTIFSHTMSATCFNRLQFDMYRLFVQVWRRCSMYVCKRADDQRQSDSALC